MTAGKDQDLRSRQVAFEINRHLPESYQPVIMTEDLRVVREVLIPRTLSKRMILIVGGAGYIGSALTAHLLARGYAVRSIDLLLYDNHVSVLPFLSEPGYEFRHGDLADTAFMESALDGITDVALLAGVVGDPITKRHPEAARMINHDGTLNLVRMLNGRGLNKVVFTSTCSNYGFIEGEAIADEDFELKPLSLYAQAKVAVEEELCSLNGKVEYHPTILRCATAFGLSPRMRLDLTVNEFTREMYVGRELLVYDVETWRPYCHIQDFCEVIRRVLEAPVENVSFEIFNTGGNANNYTKQMIVDAILEHIPGAPVRYKECDSDPRNYRVDFAKISQRLHFEPVYTVSDGIRELIAALKQSLFIHVDEHRNFYGNYEIDYPATA